MIQTPNGRVRKSFYGSTPEESIQKADIAESARCSRGDESTIRGFVRLNVWPRYAARADATRRQAAWAIDQYILPSIGGIAPEDLRLHHIQALLDSAAKGRSADTVIDIRKYLHRILRLLARERLIPYNYLEEIVAPVATVREPAHTPSQAWRLLAGSYHTDRVVFGVTLCGGFLGLCRGEMLAIEPSDLDANGLLTITDQDVYVPKQGRVRKDSLKTRDRKRRLLLPAWHSAALRIVLDGGWLTDVHPTSIGGMVARECEFLGLPRTSVHMLRKTFATGMDAVGCPRGVLMRLLGHKGDQTTDLYARGIEADGQRWLETYMEQVSTTPRGKAGVKISRELPQEVA